MKFSYNWLQSFFDKKLPKPVRLGELLSMHFAEVENITKKRNDFILDIDIRPNRSSDCFSHQGIAREISAITGFKIKKTPVLFKEIKNKKAADFISVEVKNKKLSPRYSVKIIDDIEIGGSPKWMQDLLSSCGLRPINNMVDIANYVMIETGQPLHVFDLDKIEGKKIIVRPAKNQEKINTLDNENYPLDPEILVIADEKQALAIAGIKGGKKAEVDSKTKRIVLESANFNFQTIRKASGKLNLKTDASLRFEHQIDPNLTKQAIDYFCYLIEKTACGKVVSGLVDFYPEKNLPLKISLDCEYVQRLLGVNISQKEIIAILKSLNFQVLKNNTQYLTVEPPTKRTDVLTQEDLIEEVGRIYGYHKIPSVFPVSTIVPSKKNENIFWQEVIKNILKEMGFVEVYNYSFLSEKEYQIFNYNKKNLVELKNPLSREYKFLRAGLAPGLLKNIKDNSKNFDNIMFFEIGKIYSKKEEATMIGGAIMGDKFFELKGMIEVFLSKLGISASYSGFESQPKSKSAFFWNKKRLASIKITGQEVGFLGEISPAILNEMGIKGKVVLFNIDFKKLIKRVSAEHQYRPISKFPSAIRDISVLVPKKIKVEQVSNKIYKAGQSIIKNIELFDIYMGDNIGDIKKSLAFRIIFQAEDKTLSAKEIDQLQEKIIKTLEEEPEWQVRK